MAKQLAGYKAFYKGKTIDVYASSSYEAQQLAAAELKARKSYDVTVIVCERGIGHCPPCAILSISI